MSLALKARQKVRRKGGSKEKVFGCDLRQHLQQSGQDVPQVLRSCTEFVEQHGVVDGIYRLSGVSSNIQRLRQEFEGDREPDLHKDVYLQDIHCVSSLCKAYFRELPNPLLTYQLYDKFADAVAIQMEEARLVKIKEVLKELPVPHYRTLEFLMRHLLLMASHSSRTNMHARNLAIVWAPNLLRSKDIEATGFNGTAAFMEVRVQSIVVEFILTHVEQLFGDGPLHGTESLRRSLLLGVGAPGEGQAPPYHVPAVLSQGDGPPPIRPYHTIIELGDHRRKGSLKAKKWRSIFNLGRSSHEAKRRLEKAEEKDDKGGKTSLRPAKSMDSLSSPCNDAPRLSAKRSVKQPPQRRESFDTCPPCPTVPATCSELDESLEEKLLEKEAPQGLESEGESSTKSEPTTPKAGRTSLVAPGRSPARSRAEKCVGVHISGPFAVTVPFHITSNLSRLTRGLPCPALAQAAVGHEPTLGHEPPTSPTSPAQRSDRDPQHRTGDAEQSRLSLELRDSFAFLDSPETWLESAGDGELVTRSLPPDIGDREGLLVLEEGMESGCMNPGEPTAAQPDSYLSIEECMDEEMFFMAPGDADEDTGGTDSDDNFLSAHEEFSSLAASMEPLDQPLGEEMALETPAPEIPAVEIPALETLASEILALETPAAEIPALETPALEISASETLAPAQPSANGIVVPQDRSPTAGLAGLYPREEEALGEGEHPTVLVEQEAPGEVVRGEWAEDGHSGPSRTDSSAEAGLGSDTEEAEGYMGVELDLNASVEEVKKDGVGPEEPGEGEPQPSPKSPPASSLEPLVTGSVPEVVLQIDPEVVSEVALKALLLSVASEEDVNATPGSSPGSPSLSASSLELHDALLNPSEPSSADPPVPEPLAVLRRDGSAPARLAARTIRVQQARSVPVVPPKPQFAKIPLTPQPWASLASEDADTPTVQAVPSPTSPRGPWQPPTGSGAARRAGWREGASVSFDEAVAAAVAQQPQAPVRRIQTYGGSWELPPTTPKALPFHKTPLRPRRPLSCVEGDGPGRSRLGAAQAEGPELAHRPVGTEGVAGER